MKGLLKAFATQLIPANSNRRMLYRALHDVSRHPNSIWKRFHVANIRNFIKYHGQRFACPICGNNVTPLYDFPDIRLRSEHRIGVLRETLQCRICFASMRQRALAVTWLELLNSRWSTQLPSIRALASHGLQGLQVLDSDNFSAISEILRDVPGYSRISYIPEKPFGTNLGPRYYNEDLQSLSFPSSSFDIVLTSDVMEHVRDADSAHREIYRVLRPGGHYIFTVPFEPTAEEDILLVDTSTPRDVYLCAPQFHGDPLSGGILAYRVFGQRLISQLEGQGFTVEFHLLRQLNHLIVDGDIFMAHKPS